MSAVAESPVQFKRLPDHTDLPDSDGAIVENFFEHPQGILLSDSIWPILEAKHPDRHFAVGQNSGIYWKMTDPPLDGCKAPDWFYVPDVPPTLEGRRRRSYVMWQEIIAPLLLLEVVSGDGSEERDRTPYKGKFWVYERAVRPGYYGIWDPVRGLREMYRFIGSRFVRMEPNERMHYPVPELGVELGLWHAKYRMFELDWMRFYDAEGRLLPTGSERAEQERQRADRLAAKLRALGIEPNGNDVESQP
jgi:Uma2 family endonuclease